MPQRFVRSRLARHGISLAIAGFAILLLHIFLVRLPARLLAERSLAPGITPLTAPDWATQVEGARPGSSHGAGAGTLGRGIPAAPESH